MSPVHFKETFSAQKEDHAVSIGTFDGIMYIVYYYNQGVHTDTSKHPTEQAALDAARAYIS
jgi:hypothetical protein